ncbi:hypothetical protein [uncultured Granulicatella sp.]|uniref:hypothetical protein n=1 Tax=uncultured Granulicatella sp. TaxID=316089 RepID=UPI0028EAF0A6|nr:hypothetical protein [uncultured Granulicatella sp.]
MVREGIYIGGHEIIERYVGNKLVWKKRKESSDNVRGIFIGSVDADGWRETGVNSVASFYSKNFIFRDKQHELSQVTRVEVSGKSFDITSASLIVHNGYDAVTYGEQLTFKNRAERDRFLSSLNGYSVVNHYKRIR